VIACHLGIDCPEEGDARPYISVAGKQYMWEEGAVMLFDPSFKHETFNPTSQVWAGVRVRVRVGVRVSRPSPRPVSSASS